MTVVEGMLALAVLEVAVVAVSYAVVAGNTHSHAGDQTLWAVDLAELMAEEILRLPYEDPDGPSVPGPDAGESGRTTFDNLDDYDGHSEAPGSLSNLVGDPYEQKAQAFTRTVGVLYGDQTVPDLAQTLLGLTLTIIVQDDHGTPVTVSHFVPEPAP